MRRTRLYSAMAFVGALGASALLGVGCGNDNTDGTTSTATLEPALPSIEANIFAKSCSASACHDSTFPASELDLSEGEAYRSLVGKGSSIVSGRTLVVAGDPDASFLLHKLNGDLASGEGRRMPYGGAALGEEEIAVVEEWIASGAAAE